MSIVRTGARHPILKHGQGSHDDESHGDWADGVVEDGRAPGAHGADPLNPAKGTKGGVLEDGRLRRGKAGEGLSEDHTIYLTPDQDYALDPDTIDQFPSVGSHVIKQGLREKLLLARVGDYGSSPMQLRNNLDQLLRDADIMYEDLNTQGAAGKWSKGLDTQPGWMRQVDGQVVSEYRDSYDNLIEESGDQWRWRENAGSTLRDRDRFYASWHQKFSDVAQTTKEDFGQIVAAAAVTSPGLDAVSNFQLASYLAGISRSDADITDAHRGAFREKLDEYIEMLRSPVTPEGVKKSTKLHTSHLAKADDYEARAEVIDQVAKWSEIPDSMVQARMAWAVKKVKDGVGFPVGRTWDNVGKALDILQERSSIDDALGGTQGIKVRSFFNNIIDPGNTSGEDHVTIDFQTVDAAFGMTSSDKITDVTSSGAYLGVGFGSRPFVADAVRSLTFGEDTRQLTSKWGITNSSEMQEVLWASWKRKIGTTDVPSFFDKLGEKKLSKPSGVIATRKNRTPAQTEALLAQLTVEQAEVLRLGGITQIAKALTQTGMLAPWSFQIDTDPEDPSDEWEAQLYTEDDGALVTQAREAGSKPLIAQANRTLNRAVGQVEKGVLSGEYHNPRRRRAEQIRNLKRKRKYRKPVPRFGRTKSERSTFGKVAVNLDGHTAAGEIVGRSNGQIEVMLDGTGKVVTVPATWVTKHYSPEHETGTGQDVHGSWADGGGGSSSDSGSSEESAGAAVSQPDSEQYRVHDIQGRGKEWTYKITEWDGKERVMRAAVSKDTVRRRINTVRKDMAEYLGNKDVGKVKIDYWLAWEEYKDQVAPGKSGQYPLARFEPAIEGKPWTEDQIVISPSIAVGFVDPDQYNNLQPYRVLAHELAHSSSSLGDGGLWPGADQTLEEGMAEITSLSYFAERVDISGLEHYAWEPGVTGQPPIVTGLEALVRGSAYSQYTTSLIMQAGGEVGWDRDAIKAQLKDWWANPESFTSRWERVEYLPHESVDGAGILKDRIDDAVKRAEEAVARMGSEPGWTQHDIDQVKATYDREIQNWRESSPGQGNWQERSTANFQAGVESARAAGVPVDQIQVRYRPDDSGMMEDLARLDGKTVTPNEVLEYEKSISSSFLYWLLGGNE